MEQQQKQIIVIGEELGESNQEHRTAQTVIVIYYVHPKCIMSILGTDRCETSHLFRWTSKMPFSSFPLSNVICSIKCIILLRKLYSIWEESKLMPFSLLFSILLA